MPDSTLCSRLSDACLPLPTGRATPRQRACASSARAFPPVHTLAVLIGSALLFYVPNEDDPRAGRLAVSLPDPSWDQFFSAQLVHIDAAHLWGNWIVVLLGGVLLEGMHGPLPALVVFWSAGVSGLFAEAARFPPSARLRLLGMSAAAYAQIGAQAPHILLHWKETLLAFRLLWVASLVAAISVLIFEATQNGRLIAHVAHGIGFAQGIFVGGVVLRNRRIERWESVLRVACFALATALVASSLVRHFSS